MGTGVPRELLKCWVSVRATRSLETSDCCESLQKGHVGILQPAYVAVTGHRPRAEYRACQLPWPATCSDSAGWSRARAWSPGMTIFGWKASHLFQPCLLLSC